MFQHLRERLEAQSVVEKSDQNLKGLFQGVDEVCNLFKKTFLFATGNKSHIKVASQVF